MTVYLVGAGPGDPGLLTCRGAELLARAEVVVYDRLVDRRILERVPASAERIDVGKKPGRSQRQEDINALLVDRGRSGQTVVRLNGGDPFLFGRGGEELLALAEAGVPAEVVPGVSSAIAVPAYAGIPVTHRGHATSVSVVTGHVGDPTAPGGVDWTSLARAGGTLVILMGIENRAEIAAELMAGGRPPETPVAVVEWGTTPAQRTVRTTLAGLGQVMLGPPATIVVGAVADLALGSAEQRPLHGWRVAVTRARAQSAALIESLEAAGADVLAVPLIAVEDAADGGVELAKRAGEVQDYDWVVCTSANSVERFTAHIRDGRSLAGVAVAAVGPGTAAAFRAHGILPDLVASEGTAESLVASFPESPATGRVLFPRSAEARDVLAPGLRAKGWQVDDVEAYRTVLLADTANRDEKAVLREALQGVEVLTCTSPSTVRALHFLLGSEPPAGLVVCIGPTTAAAVSAVGWPVAAVAEERSTDGVVRAVVGLRHPPGRSPS